MSDDFSQHLGNDVPIANLVSCASQRPPYPFGVHRRFIQAHARGVGDGVGDRRRGGDDARLADAARASTTTSLLATEQRLQLGDALLGGAARSGLRLGTSGLRLGAS